MGLFVLTICCVHFCLLAQLADHFSRCISVADHCLAASDEWGVAVRRAFLRRLVATVEGVPLDTALARKKRVLLGPCFEAVPVSY